MLIFLLGFAQRSPTISYISQEQIKDIGGAVELVCSVQYAQEYPVLWMRKESATADYNLPISTGSSLILHDSRFSLRYDTVSVSKCFIIIIIKIGSSRLALLIHYKLKTFKKLMLVYISVKY